VAVRVLDRGGGAVAGPGLGEDPIDVRLDRVGAQEQPGGDLGVGQALGDKAQDLDLAFGEPVRSSDPVILPLFVQPLVDWAIANDVTAAAITDGLIFMAIAMVIVRTLSLRLRANRLPGSTLVAQAA
jgi:hypothetical protein